MTPNQLDFLKESNIANHKKGTTPACLQAARVVGKSLAISPGLNDQDGRTPVLSNPNRAASCMQHALAPSPSVGGGKGPTINRGCPGWRLWSLVDGADNPRPRPAKPSRRKRLARGIPSLAYARTSAAVVADTVLGLLGQRHRFRHDCWFGVPSNTNEPLCCSLRHV
jgi:hypothetical protein